MQQPYPILEYSSTPEAIIEPKRIIKPLDVPKHCVICFFQDVIADICQQRQAKIITHLKTEIGDHPLYEIMVSGQRLAVIHPGVGAPLGAGLLEEVIACGCRKFIACGGAGVLDRQITVGHLVVPTSAVRDEGTSYHYLPPAREVAASLVAVAAIERVLTESGIPYLLGKTWTTDAVYRETAEKILARRAEGCLTVEMEAAAFFAVAQFRNVPLGQILYGGDDVSGENWDDRSWSKHSIRQRLFWLAADACLAMGDGEG